MTRGIPYLEGQAIKAAKEKTTSERAMTHPWESPPPEDDRLYATAPLDAP